MKAWHASWGMWLGHSATNEHPEVRPAAHKSPGTGGSAPWASWSQEAWACWGSFHWLALKSRANPSTSVSWLRNQSIQAQYPVILGENVWGQKAKYVGHAWAPCKVMCSVHHTATLGQVCLYSLCSRRKKPELPSHPSQLLLPLLIWL